MKQLGTLFALGGIALAAVLFAREDIGAIVHLLTIAAPGLVVASLVHVVPMMLNAAAWQRLFAPQGAPTPGRLLHATWLRESVNGLLPVARIGGEIVAYRVVRVGGVSPIDAASTLVADMAISVITQAWITLVGLAILMRVGIGATLAIAIAVAAGALIVAGIAFVLAQRAGIVAFVARWANRVFAGRFEGAIAGSLQFDDAIRAIYDRRRDVAACAVLQCAGWIAGGAEIWLALYFLGHPCAPLDAVMIEVLIQAVGSAAFVVPGALGVQEATFLVVGAVVGLDGATALALAAARRVRDVVVFFPGLLAWHRAESHVAAASESSNP